MLPHLLAAGLAGAECCLASRPVGVGLASFLVLVAGYYLVVALDPLATIPAGSGVGEEAAAELAKAEQQRKAKAQSWILTSASSLVMTLGALPFVYDLVTSGWDVARVQRRAELAQGLSAFFVAYLVAVRVRLAVPAESCR